VVAAVVAGLLAGLLAAPAMLVGHLVGLLAAPAKQGDGRITAARRACVRKEAGGAAASAGTRACGRQAAARAQEFEKTLDGWMAEMHALLTYDNPALAEADPERESAPEAVMAAVCQNINLFMEARRGTSFAPRAWG
jgi:hypothetical protein